MKRLLTFKQLNETFSNWTLVRDADKMWNELHKSDCYKNMKLAKDSTNNEFLIQSVKNPVLMKFIVKELLNDIKKITPSIKRDNMNFHDYSKMWWELEIRWLDLKVKSKLENLLKTRQENLLKNGTILAYKISEHPLFNLVGDDLELTGESELWINIFIKDLYSKRFNPPKYLYHSSSSENRESIKKNGLKKIEFSKGNWTLESLKNYYPPSVFATVEKDGWYNKVIKGDVWRIDTTNLKNIWWEDLNFYRHEDPNKEPVDCVMTFDSIPTEHLELVHKK